MQLSNQVKISPDNVIKLSEQTERGIFLMDLLYCGMKMINISRYHHTNYLIMSMQMGGVYLSSNIIKKLWKIPNKNTKMKSKYC